MTKGAAEVAASSLDEDIATAEALLRTQTFQQRLDQARAARERALQAKGPDDLSAATLSKPWEKPLPPRQQGSGELPARRLERAAPTLFFPAGTVPASVANAAEAAPMRPISAPSAEITQASPTLPRSGLVRTVIGFSFGLGLGLGVAYFVLQPSPSAPETSTPASATVPQVEKAVMPDPLPPAITLAGPGQPDVPVITPALAEARPAARLAGAPSASAPETLPNLPLALSVAAPTVWWPEMGNLPALAENAAPPLAPEEAGPVAAIRPPAPVGAPANPEAAAEYGQEARNPPVADPAPRYSGLSVRILSAAATDAPPLTQIADTLAGAGFPPADIGQVSYTIKQTHVRFYHAADAAAAAAMADNLGIAARDFSQTTPLPPEGLIEVWVAPPGSAAAQTPPAAVAPKPAPVKAAAKKKPAAKQPPKTTAAEVDRQAAEAAEAAQLKARILQMLQGSATP